MTNSLSIRGQEQLQSTREWGLDCIEAMFIVLVDDISRVHLLLHNTFII